jgi:hypothetical protein
MDLGQPLAQQTNQARGPLTPQPEPVQGLSLSSTDRWDPPIIPDLQPRISLETKPETPKSSPFNCPLILAKFNASPRL